MRFNGFGKLAFGLAVSTLHCATNVNLNVNAESRLQATYPENLRMSGGYNHTDAQFGWTPTIGSMEQPVYYTDDPMCDRSINRDARIWPSPDHDGHGSLPTRTSFILMVDRGGCSFVRKVRNAQYSGASAVLIADNICQCSSGSSCFSDDVGCEAHEPDMGDDGSGGDVGIPSFMMLKEDADQWKRLLTEDFPVRAKMSWSAPDIHDHVDVEFWTIPTLGGMGNVPPEPLLGSLANALGESATFTPHMSVTSGTKFLCDRASDSDPECSTMCTNHGRYCSLEAYYYYENGVIQGASIMAETLRRLCIWRNYGSVDNGFRWWKYVNEFTTTCTGESFKDDDCITGAMEIAGVDGRAIDECMSHSGGLDANIENTILQAEMELAERKSLVAIPSLYVNKRMFQGRFNAEEILGDICSRFTAESLPRVCIYCRYRTNVEQCINEVDGDGGGNPKGGDAYGYADDDGVLIVDPIPASQKPISHTTFFVSVIALIGTLGAAGVVYHQRTRRNMQTQVRGILSEYMLLDNSNNQHDASLEAVTLPPSAGVGSVPLGQMG
eukprot:CAMPEP_0198135420 /NCGR_PEP_ID=MMETSP1442-20131203/60582_1 /TAXON_ID= /ORGANISM="Craspedostauros australis, Strain CCMP3328" /LENGTH=552 /DNA_ID=CAMNT_0043796589 /DNA_START=719 /DNA_END=2377 /DNA_ORIENTATION=+